MNPFIVHGLDASSLHGEISFFFFSISNQIVVLFMELDS